MAEAKFGRLKVTLPRSKAARRALGATLCVGGVLGFLPILGFWMLPLGVGVLAVDSPRLRRIQKRAIIKVARWRRSRRVQPHARKEGGPE